MDLYSFDIYSSKIFKASFPWPIDFRVGLNSYTFFLMAAFFVVILFLNFFSTKEDDSHQRDLKNHSLIYLMISFLFFSVSLISFDYIITGFFVFSLVFLYLLYILLNRERMDLSLRPLMWIFGFSLLCLMLSIGIIGINVQTSSLMDLISLIATPRGETLLSTNPDLYYVPFLLGPALFTLCIVLPYITTLYFETIKRYKLLLFFNFFLFPSIGLILIIKFWPLIFFLKSSFSTLLSLSLLSALIFALFSFLYDDNLEKRLNFLLFSLLSLLFAAFATGLLDYGVKLLFFFVLFAFFLSHNVRIYGESEKRLFFSQFELFILVVFTVTPLYIMWKLFLLFDFIQGFFKYGVWVFAGFTILVNVYLLSSAFFDSCHTKYVVKNQRNIFIMALFLVLLCMTSVVLLDLFSIHYSFVEGSENLKITFFRYWPYLVFILFVVALLVMNFMFSKKQMRLEKIIGLSSYLSKIHLGQKKIYVSLKNSEDLFIRSNKKCLYFCSTLKSFVKEFSVRAFKLITRIFEVFENVCFKNWTLKMIDARTLLGLSLCLLLILIFLFNFNEGFDQSFSMETVDFIKTGEEQ